MKKRPGNSAAAKSDKVHRLRVAVALSVAALVAVSGAGLLVGRRAAHSGAREEHAPRTRGQLTFTKHIAPIVFEHCAGCHRPGQAAPFSLLSFQDVKKHATDIAEVTARRYMPPWLPEHGYGEFADERRLSAEQIGVIQQWVAEGAVEGSPADSPPPPKWADGWQLGRPDLVAQLPEAYTVPPNGRDVYRNFVVPLRLTERRFVQAVEFRANTKVLHHVFIRFDRSRHSRRLDAQDAEVGFGGMSLPASVETPGGYFLSWQPGRGPTRSPAGLAWPLEPGSDLILQAHIQPSGKAEKVQPSIAFYFTDQAPTNTPFKIGLSSYAIDIPPGARDYEVRDSYVLPVDVELLAVLPHAHYLAKEIHGYAVLPDGRKRWLIKINDWDFNWQSDYRYAQSIHLPKGTCLTVRLTYDNSAENVRNPNRPPTRVKYGLQSTDEMGELWFQVLPHSAADSETLQAHYKERVVQDVIALNKLMLQQNPTNAHAHVQMANAMLALGRRAEGLAHLRRAVELDPNEEEGHYHLGVLAMSSSDAHTAEVEFNETIRVNPENFHARNNLGLVLMHLGRFTEAEEQFQTALRLNPGDRLVKENLDLLARARAGRK
jgi:tetratricopeptide (TPR) repeat protein/mono/diheme cytochrome c family protein